MCRTFQTVVFTVEAAGSIKVADAGFAGVCVCVCVCVCVIV